MPHKHKRKRDEDPDHDLPPSQRARPLPVGKQPKGKDGKPAKSATEPKNRSKKQRKEDNDAPRGFRRMMAVASGKKFHSGLDDGKPKAKGKEIEEKTEAPKIRPGEDMRSFAQRVDASLPISGLKQRTVVKDGKDEQGVKVWRTRKEMKMHKLFDQWRAEERKAKERRAEDLEREAEKALENDGEGITSTAYMAALDEDDDKPKAKGKGKKKRGKQEEDDPWAALKKKRAEAKVGLHDVAMAPPDLKRGKPRNLQVSEGAGVDVGNIPKAAGSLKRREELQAERDQVLEAYRKIREHEQAKLTGSA